jgi:hypothetical protein
MGDLVLNFVDNFSLKPVSASQTPPDKGDKFHFLSLLISMLQKFLNPDVMCVVEFVTFV